MSLTVPPELLTRAEAGEVDDAAFVACVRDSLPFAYALIEDLSSELHNGGLAYVDNLVEPPDEQARGQLLRAMASDAIRSCLQRHFGVRLAFQNCHRAAAFRLDADGELAEFTSTRSQILNQSPALVNC